MQSLLFKTTRSTNLFQPQSWPSSSSYYHNSVATSTKTITTRQRDAASVVWKRYVMTTKKLCQQKQKQPSSSGSNNNSNKIKVAQAAESLASSSSSSSSSYQIMIPGFAIGIIAGTCGSLAGMGGGFIMIPLMTSSHPLLAMSLSQHVAHGTSLFAVAATGIAGATSYATSSKHAVHIESAVSIAVCAMMTARLGALYSTKLSQSSLKKVLGVFMICVSPIIPLKSKLEEMTKTNNNHNNNVSNFEKEGQNIGMSHDSFINDRVMNSIISGSIGLGSGFMAGLLGVGGGAVVVPALTLCTSMDHYTALGTSLAAMVFPAIVGTATHFKKGNVNLRVAPALAVGALVGAYGGGRLGVHVEEDLLRYGFSGLMLGLGLKTFFKV